MWRKIKQHRLYVDQHKKTALANTKKFKRMELLGVLVPFIIAVLITGYCLKLLQTQILIRNMVQEGIDYDAFREMRIDEGALQKSDKYITEYLKKHPEAHNMPYINSVGYLTFSMLAKEYNLKDFDPVDEITFTRGIGRIVTTSAFQELYSYYKGILMDLQYFPVPRLQKADVSYEDSWYDLRSYGGNRRHEGTDLMASNNQRGYFPILSITDGTVEKMGWLEQGGYRIGIRSEEGGYFYYAHLYSYAPELKEGDRVIAGQLLGFMGDSGYGKEGTIGQFDVHLHLGVYVDSSIGEMSVNPYWILKLLEKSRTDYEIQ